MKYLKFIFIQDMNFFPKRNIGFQDDIEYSMMNSNKTFSFPISTFTHAKVRKKILNFMLIFVNHAYLLEIKMEFYSAEIFKFLQKNIWMVQKLKISKLHLNDEDHKNLRLKLEKHKKNYLKISNAN